MTWPIYSRLCFTLFRYGVLKHIATETKWHIADTIFKFWFFSMQIVDFRFKFQLNIFLVVSYVRTHKNQNHRGSIFPATLAGFCVSPPKLWRFQFHTFSSDLPFHFGKRVYHRFLEVSLDRNDVANLWRYNLVIHHISEWICHRSSCGAVNAGKCVNLSIWFALHRVHKFCGTYSK